MEVVVAENVRVPDWVQDLDSFRRWCHADDFPQECKISYFADQLWIDPHMERDLHNQIKTAIVAVLFTLVQVTRLGRFYGDRMRLVHPEANLSTESDALFASHLSFQRQRVQLREKEDSLELIGSPDMALEVVSRSSVQKDTVRLLDLYHKARLREYWLVNPLAADVEFKIYRYTAKK